MTSSPNRRQGLALLLAAAGFVYPFAVYFGLGRMPPGAFVLVALVLVGARLISVSGAAAARPLAPAMAAVALGTAVAGLTDAAVTAKLYPILMSLGMAGAFGLSLVRPPTLIEIFARLSEPEPSPQARAYMRRVTQVWLVFLLVNAAVSAASLASGDLRLWTLYNGLVSYLLMGVLFAGEYLVRRRVRARSGGR
ncbi:MAG: hypothetical protein M0006_01695 [Magnetospirillum sp.]|nr:hypothetical protein [Magnetospirillum sp.]